MEIPLDLGERRWRQNVLAGRQVAGGQFHAYNATATPLDAYRHAKVITQRQYDAGNYLRDNWIRAGLEPRVIPDIKAALEGAGHGSGEVTDDEAEKRAKALRRVRRRLAKLEPEPASCVWHVCCMGECAEAWAQRMGRPGANGLVGAERGVGWVDGREGKGCLTRSIAGEFMGELQAFRVRLTAKGRDTYAARSGKHDDLVIAVALAVWGGVTMSALSPKSSALHPGADLL